MRYLFVFLWLVASLCTADEAIDVMSFNVRYGTARDGANHWKNRRKMVVQTIHKHDPDLLGGQEVLDFQRDYLKQELPGYGCIGVGRDDGKNRGEMTAVFFRMERFEMLASGHFWLSPTPDKVGSRGWDAAIPRMATWVKLRDKQASDARPLLFLNTHFDHRGAEARKRSAELIVQQLKTLGAGACVVVTGDFNAAEGSKPYAALFDPRVSGLLDTYRVFVPTPTPDEGTFTGFKTADGRARIDWVACSDHFAVVDAKIVRDKIDGRWPSDHFPVTARLLSLDQ